MHVIVEMLCLLCSTGSGCRYGASCRFLHNRGDVAADDKTADDAGNGAAACEAGLTSDSAVDGVQKAIAGLNVVDESCSNSLPVAAAGNSSSPDAAACSSTNSLDSASGAAAATKFSRKKKKSAKKGARKMKQESKSKELVLYDHQTVKCGMLIFHVSYCLRLIATY